MAILSCAMTVTLQARAGSDASAGERPTATLASAATAAPTGVATAAFALSASPPAPGFSLVDRGTMVMRGGALGRSEQFETWLGPAGESWMRSIVIADDGSYRVEGEWRSDAAGALRTARGRGAIGADSLAVQLEARPGAAFTVVERGTRAPERIEGKCAPECFIDLSPSAVAMFAMTRDARVRVGEAREFRWIGHALTADSVLVDGVARFLRLGEEAVRRADGSTLTVRHDVFQETVGDLRSGFTAKVFFNLWTDVDGRPLKFASSRVIGLRAGYEDLAALPAATLQSAFPDVAAPPKSAAAP